MKRNNKALYEQIMKSVSKQVKEALNEDYRQVNIKYEVGDYVWAKDKKYNDLCPCVIDDVKVKVEYTISLNREEQYTTTNSDKDRFIITGLQ